MLTLILALTPSSWSYELDSTYDVGPNWRMVRPVVNGGPNVESQVFVRSSISNPVYAATPIATFATEAARLIDGAEPGSTNTPNYPGADFDLIEYAPSTNSCSTINTVSEVCSKGNDWFDAHEADHKPYLLLKNTAWNTVDIVLNRDGVAWTTDSTIGGGDGRVSIVQVLAQAFARRQDSDSRTTCWPS